MTTGLKVDGDKVMRLRLEKMVMDRREMAKKVGISTTALYMIEVNPQRTKPKTLRKVAEVLGVPPQELVRTQNPNGKG